MRATEIVRKLEDAGFVLRKRGKKHLIWVKGSYTVLTPGGSGKMSPRGVTGALVTIKRAEEEAKHGGPEGGVAELVKGRARVRPANAAGDNA